MRTLDADDSRSFLGRSMIPPLALASTMTVSSSGKSVRPRSANQKAYVDAIFANDLTIGIAIGIVTIGFGAASSCFQGAGSGQIENIIGAFCDR